MGKRTWGSKKEYAEQGASARRQSLVANGYDSPTVRQWQNYDRRGFAVVTEPGSNGWLGYFMLGDPAGVTRVESLNAQKVEFQNELQRRGNQTRGEKMRRGKAARQRVRMTDPSSGSSPSPIAADLIATRGPEIGVPAPLTSWNLRK